VVVPSLAARFSPFTVRRAPRVSSVVEKEEREDEEGKNDPVIERQAGSQRSTESFEPLSCCSQLARTGRR